MCAAGEATRLAYIWLSRAVLCGGGLGGLAGAHEAVTRRTLQHDIEQGRVLEAEFLTVLRGIRFGIATPESRLQQWRQWTKKKKEGGGQYEEKRAIARAFAKLCKAGAFKRVAAEVEQAETEGDVESCALEA